MLIEEMISAIQLKLGIDADGKAGPQTWGAIYARLVEGKTGAQQQSSAISKVDSRSEKVIATLVLEVQPIARALVQKAASVGITIKVISGLRSFAEQDKLYALGRTVPGEKIVTNARGGYSNHNFGIAFDIGVFDKTEYLEDSPKYKVVGALGIELGLEWGGNWETLVDQPHFQLRPEWASNLSETKMLTELRSRHAAGLAIYS